MPLMDAPYEKQPWEEETVEIDWTKRAGSLVIAGYAISAIDVKVYESSVAGTEHSEMVVDTPSYIGFLVYVTLGGGVSGTDYFARFRVTLTKGPATPQKTEADLLIKVRERGK
jgi:hypothetical protein